MLFSQNNQNNVMVTSLAPVFIAIASRHRDNCDDNQRHDIQRQDARRSDDKHRAVVEKQVEHQNKTQQQDRADASRSHTNDRPTSRFKSQQSSPHSTNTVSTNTFAATINTTTNAAIQRTVSVTPQPQATNISPQQIITPTISPENIVAAVAVPIITTTTLPPATPVANTVSTAVQSSAFTIFNSSGRVKNNDDDEREDENDGKIVSVLSQVSSDNLPVKKTHVAMEIFTSLFPSSTQHTTQSTVQNTVQHAEQNNTHNQDTQDTIALVQRVVAALQSGANRGDTIRIRMHPESLGSVAVRVRLKDGKMQATLRVENRDARSLLLSQRGTLRERLARQQIDLEEFQVEIFTDDLTEREL